MKVVNFFKKIKNANKPKFCNIIFFAKIGSAEPVYQQIKLVLP